MHTASIWGEGKFCLDREFSKNAPYKQKIIFHLASNDKMSQKNFLFAWTVDWWYAAGGWIGVERSPNFKALFLDSQSSFLILN